MIQPPFIDVTNINKKVYNFIKQNILNYDYPPGYAININKLSTILGVSQTPIKDAIARLAGEGLVEIAPRKGTYVKNITAVELHELMKVRLILETAVIEEIAPIITDEQLQSIESIYQKSLDLKLNAENYELYMELNSQFHLSFFNVMGNGRLTAIYKKLNVHAHIVRFRTRHHAKGKLPTTDQEHEKIFMALREHDPVKAKKAIQDHLSSLDMTWAVEQCADKQLEIQSFGR